MHFTFCQPHGFGERNILIISPWFCNYTSVHAAELIISYKLLTDSVKFNNACHNYNGFISCLSKVDFLSVTFYRSFNFQSSLQFLSKNFDKCSQELGVDTTLEVSKLTPCKFFFMVASSLLLTVSITSFYSFSAVWYLWKSFGNFLDRLWSEGSKEGWFLQ